MSSLVLPSRPSLLLSADRCRKSETDRTCVRRRRVEVFAIVQMFVGLHVDGQVALRARRVETQRAPVRLEPARVLLAPRQTRVLRRRRAVRARPTLRRHLDLQRRRRRGRGRRKRASVRRADVRGVFLLQMDLQRLRVLVRPVTFQSKRASSTVREREREERSPYISDT